MPRTSTWAMWFKHPGGADALGVLRPPAHHRHGEQRWGHRDRRIWAAGMSLPARACTSSPPLPGTPKEGAPVSARVRGLS